MAIAPQDDFQSYFARLRPIYHQLFNLAHAVTGNRDQAEYSLQFAMLDCWASGDASASNHGFREGLRSSTLRAALRTAAEEEAEFDWNNLSARDGEADPLLRQIRQEPVELRRMLALHYGCGLSPRRIARLMDADVSRVRALFKRYEARARRRHAGRSDAVLGRLIRACLSESSPQAPSMSSVFRSFRADAMAIARPNHLPARILRAIFALILALLCVIAFWLAAVLIQPAVLENPNSRIETSTE